MAFEIKYPKEAEENLDAIATWLLYERRAGETALRWLQGLREKIDTLSEQPERRILARESKSLRFELRQLLYGRKPRVSRGVHHRSKHSAYPLHPQARRKSGALKLGGQFSIGPSPGAFVSPLPAGHGTSSVSRNRFLFA